MAPTIQFKAAMCCWERKIPFVFFIRPGESAPFFWANPSFGKKRIATVEKFIINPWLGKFSDLIEIESEMGADEILDSNLDYSDTEEICPWKRSTPQDEYIERVSTLISRLKLRGGKTVYSRTECGSMENVDVAGFINSQFDFFSDTFRYFFYTPQTGAWVGTSPEILLDMSFITGDYKIMSLAGTRTTDDTSQWDNKNIAEQSLVARFIGDLLNEFAIPFTLKRCNDVVFKPVCHICDIFTGKMDIKLYSNLLDRLSPTPALGGYPVRESLEDIARLETHDRRCYGGYVGYVNSDELVTYVNLRCVNFSHSRYCIYAGGGITAASNPGAEWDETQNKTKILRHNLNNAIKI